MVKQSPWITLAILSSIGLISMHAETMLLPAIPDIITDFHINYSTSSWILTILSTIIGDIEDMHAKGKINNEYYTNLKKETSVLYQEIFKKRIDSLNNLPENDKGKLLIELKDDISDAY